MKITNEIFQIGGKDLSFHQDGGSFLINFGGHAAIVDVGTGRGMDKLVNNINECGVDPKQIEYLLMSHSHFDHVGGAKDFKTMAPCLTVAHELTAQYLEQADDVVTAAYAYKASLQPFFVDRKITGNREKIELGGRIITAIHAPGHSPDSMAFFTESEGLKVLLAQDVFGPLDPIILSNREDYLKSRHQMQLLEADILCDGHCGIFKGKAVIKNYIESCLR